MRVRFSLDLQSFALGAALGAVASPGDRPTAARLLEAAEAVLGEISR